MQIDDLIVIFFLKKSSAKTIPFDKEFKRGGWREFYFVTIFFIIFTTIIEDGNLEVVLVHSKIHII